MIISWCQIEAVRWIVQNFSLELLKQRYLLRLQYGGKHYMQKKNFLSEQSQSFVFNQLLDTFYGVHNKYLLNHAAWFHKLSQQNSLAVPKQFIIIFQLHTVSFLGLFEDWGRIHCLNYSLVWMFTNLTLV